MNIKKMVLCALLSAMCAVLGYFAIDATAFRITFESLPILIAGMLLGPIAGMAVGAVGTFIYQMLVYGFSPTTVLWILPYIICGLIVGLYSARKKYNLSMVESLVIVLICEFIVLVLNTGVMYLDSQIFGYYFPGFITGSLLLRLGVCVGKGICFGLIIPPLLKGIKKSGVLA